MFIMLAICALSSSISDMFEMFEVRVVQDFRVFGVRGVQVVPGYNNVTWFGGGSKRTLLPIVTVQVFQVSVS